MDAETVTQALKQLRDRGNLHDGRYCVADKQDSEGDGHNWYTAIYFPADDSQCSAGICPLCLANILTELATGRQPAGA